MRKRLMILICCMLILCPSPARAEPMDNVPLTGVRTAVLVEPTTGEKIAGIDAASQQHVAGLAKLPAILTLAQAFDEGAILPDVGVRISRHAASISGPTAFLDADDSIAASELMKAAIMISAGDAIMAIGEHAFGSENVFVDNINATLRMLGISKEMDSAMGETATFSAEELALLGAAAAKSETFLRYSTCYMDAITHADGRTTELVNANRLIRSYAGCSGIMTGSSQADGYGGVFYAYRSGMPLVAVVIGASNASDRFVAAEKLLDHGYSNYRLFHPAAKSDVMEQDVPVRGGEKKAVSLVAGADTAVLLKKSVGEPVETREIPEYLTAPIDAATKAGVVRYADGQGETIAEIKLYPAASVASFGILDIVRMIAADFIGVRQAD